VSQFDDFLDAAKANLSVLGKDSFDGYSAEVKAMVQAALDKAQTNLKRWTAQLAVSQLTQAEFKNLVQGETDLTEIAGYTAAGMSIAQAQRLRDAVTLTVIDTALDTFLKTPPPP
jgi:xanthine dehydrogenase iron-sulfur cluster and FAD-binding subunit A